ncbi:MAG: Nif3-like dinuclear metal center hexameric protein [Paludibacteraceae bacterium]
MNVAEITNLIEDQAPVALQESYDNAGLILGNGGIEVKGILITIDVTEEVIEEAIQGDFNLIISHHPLIFRGIKKITGKNEVERCIQKAIKNDIAVYAAHTNIDNVQDGVNGKIAEKLQLINTKILVPKEKSLVKLVTYVPKNKADVVRKALFDAGAGNIGNYDECSFNAEGFGTFRGNKKAMPYVGQTNKQHCEPEVRIEVILPTYLIKKTVSSLVLAHPYEEPAYDIIPLLNNCATIGAGIIGELNEEMDELSFLYYLKTVFELSTVKYTSLSGKKIKKVALCGGSGSEFLQDAIGAGADVFISADFKYHEYFEAKNKILIADIGHFESEQYTKEVFYEIITKKMPKFAVRISKVNTNPIKYL